MILSIRRIRRKSLIVNTARVRPFDRKKLRRRRNSTQVLDRARRLTDRQTAATSVGDERRRRVFF